MKNKITANGTFDLDAAIAKILEDNDEEVLEGIAITFYRQYMLDEETLRKKARAMLQAYRDGSVDDFCMALTGWRFESILHLAGALPAVVESFPHCCRGATSGVLSDSNPTT